MKKFILIDHEPWTLRRKQLFYDLFEKAGINLTVWDISQWLYPGINISDEISEANYVTKIINQDQFINKLKNEKIDNTIIIEEVIRNWNNRKVFKLLSNYGFRTIKFDFYGHAGLNVSLKDKISNITINKIISFLKHKTYGLLLRFYNSYNKVNRPERIFSSTHSKYITDQINHPDYELYKFTNPQHIIEEEYMVFCDIFFPEHPDFRYVAKLDNICAPSVYRSKMIRLFDYLESKYHIPVIIAAHPKANYRGDEWGNRKIIKYQTNNLVAYSRIVISHVSGSVTFALLHKKPLLFVGTKEYFSLPNIIYEMDILATKTLGLPYYNLDKDAIESIEIRGIDENIRRQYILSYLSSEEIEDKPNWKILQEKLIN